MTGDTSSPSAASQGAGGTLAARAALVIGAAAGFVGALMGGGGGVLMVPALDRFTRMPRARVSGTATIANAAIALAGLALYGAWQSLIDWPLVLAMAAGGVAGAFAGARVLRALPERWLRVALIVVIAVAVVKVVASTGVASGSTSGASAASMGAAAGAPAAASPAAEAPALAHHAAWRLVGAAIVGVVVGAWSSAMGMGGGILAVPALTALFGCPLAVAIGSSLALMLPNALAGTVAHLRLGTANLRLGLLLGAGAMAGTLAGALAVGAIDARRLALLYGALLGAIGLRECVVLVRAERSLARGRRR